MENQDFDNLEALSVREVAALVHVSRPTVEKWIKSGELLSLHLGGCRRVMRADLQRFLEYRRRWGWQPIKGKYASRRANDGEYTAPPDDPDVETFTF